MKPHNTILLLLLITLAASDPLMTSPHGIAPSFRSTPWDER